MQWGISDFISLAAIVISIMVPIAQLIYKSIFKRLKIDLYMFGSTYLFFDSYGSYMQTSFAIHSENCDVIIENIELKCTKIGQGKTLDLK